MPWGRKTQNIQDAMEASACEIHIIFWQTMERSFMFLLVMNVMPHSLVDRHKHLEELLSPSWGQKQAESPSKTWVTHQNIQRHNHGYNCNGTWTLQEEKGLCLQCTRLNNKRRNTTKTITNYKIQRKVLKFSILSGIIIYSLNSLTYGWQVQPYISMCTEMTSWKI